MTGFDDLTDDERAAVVTALRQAIDQDRYPLSPRMRPFKTALAKLDPSSSPKTRVAQPPLPEAAAHGRGGEAMRGSQ